MSQALQAGHWARFSSEQPFISQQGCSALCSALTAAGISSCSLCVAASASHLASKRRSKTAMVAVMASGTPSRSKNIAIAINTASIALSPRKSNKKREEIVTAYSSLQNKHIIGCRQRLSGNAPILEVGSVTQNGEMLDGKDLSLTLLSGRERNSVSR
jgi:hypothetical protein